MDRLRMTTLAGLDRRMMVLPRKVVLEELLRDEPTFQIRFGLRKTPASIAIRGDDHQRGGPLEIQISPDVISDLRLLPGLRYNLKVDRLSGTIAFGPVVGVFVNPRFLAHFEQGEPPASARYHGLAAWEAHVFLYYFSQEQLNWDSLTTPGWVFRDGQWSHQEVPLPDVIYDQGVFKDEEQEFVDNVRARLRLIPEVQLINSHRRLDKWSVHQRLAGHAEVSPHLPETVRYRDLSDLAELLKRHPRVFVKSFYGSWGKEVLAVEKTGPHSYACHSISNEAEAGTLREVHSLIQRSLGTDKVIVQQGIPLLQHQGRNLDMRVLLHKDGTGKWRVTYNQVWVASRKRLITTSGEPVPFMEIMPAVLGSTEKAEATEKEVAELSFLIARLLEEEFGPFGELGLDLALDRQGQIWLLEANRKPAKHPHSFESGSAGLFPQFTRVFEYSRFLTGFLSDSWQVG